MDGEKLYGRLIIEGGTTVSNDSADRPGYVVISNDDYGLRLAISFRYAGAILGYLQWLGEELTSAELLPGFGPLDYDLTKARRDSVYFRMDTLRSDPPSTDDAISLRWEGFGTRHWQDTGPVLIIGLKGLYALIEALEALELAEPKRSSHDELRMYPNWQALLSRWHLENSTPKTVPPEPDG